MSVETITFPLHNGGGCDCYDCRYFGGQQARIVETIVVVEVEKKTFAGETATTEQVALTDLELCGLQLEET